MMMLNLEYYPSIFLVTAGLCGAIKLAEYFVSNYQAQVKTKAIKEGFSQFQWGWLAVYYAVIAADWLQGPYVFALYASYNFEKADIAMLFIAGYFSSLVVGTFTGSLADAMGRKWGCLCFGLVYSLSCLTKLSSD